MKLAALFCLLVPSLALAENQLMDDKQTVTYDCATDAATDVVGNENVIVLQGECDEVNVSGNHNKITGVHAKSINVSGTDNALAIKVMDAVNLTGNRNALTWTKASAKDAGPTVNNVGKGNKISGVAPKK